MPEAVRGRKIEKNMSHFTVMVIGNNPQDQLAPYHEFECTGVDDQYIQDIDQTQDILDLMSGDDPMTLQEALECHGLDDRTINDGGAPDTAGPHKYGYAVLDSSGLLIKAVDRTNPNAKWDWRTLGGRWSGFLLLKNGRKADSAIKKDIDFDLMAERAKAKAIDQYNDLAKQFGGEIPKIDISWKEMLADQSFADHDARRDAYWAQPALAKMKELKIDTFYTDLEDYQCTVEEFGNRAADESIATYALVIGSKWYAKGEMGWFGMSSGDVDQSEWNEKVRQMLASVSDDTLISIYDCHI